MDSIITRINQIVPIVSSRLEKVVAWYLLSLMLPARKHSLAHAATLSGKSKSAFSRLLSNSRTLSARVLYNLAIDFNWACRKSLVGGSAWTIAIIIDSTIKHRSSTRVQNSQKFNHGSGFEIGHQFTNVVLLIGTQLIPLRPIPFYTKGYCKKHGITYTTEHTRVARYLAHLDLTEIVGPHRASEIVVLCDSGYDDRYIYNTILEKGWHLVASLKSNSHVDLEIPMQNGTRRVDELFGLVRGILWQTVYAWKQGKKRERKDFRACALRGRLKGLDHLVLLVCSEPRRDRRKKRKHLICSDPKVDVAVVVHTYRLRWAVEIFHREIKVYLGFQDIAAKDFKSVESHINWVYVAYVVLQRLFPKAATLNEAQQAIGNIRAAEPLRQILRLTGRFGGMEAIKSQCYEAVHSTKAA